MWAACNKTFEHGDRWYVASFINIPKQSHNIFVQIFGILTDIWVRPDALLNCVMHFIHFNHTYPCNTVPYNMNHRTGTVYLYNMVPPNSLDSWIIHTIGSILHCATWYGTQNSVNKYTFIKNTKYTSPKCAVCHPPCLHRVCRLLACWQLGFHRLQMFGISRQLQLLTVNYPLTGWLSIPIGDIVSTECMESGCDWRVL